MLTVKTLQRTVAVSIYVSLCTLASCADDTDLDGYSQADLHEGGRLYDRIWADTPPDEFAGDHPLWAERPDMATNNVKGAETWRCKECHGWDYLGADGQYGTGPHRTGFPGILGTERSPTELFRLLGEEPSDLAGGHGYSRFMRERELWDLVRFCLEGAVETTDIINDDGTFAGEGPAGEDLFARGIGPERSCASCHGAQGQQMPHVDRGHDDEPDPPEEPEDEREPEHDETVGSVARENPWEFHHKARFGHPGSPMHGYQRGGASHEDMAALGAFAQSLP